MSAIALARRPDWPERFIAFIESRRFLPFQWGFNDCCLFCADGILAMTDVDLARGRRGYRTERGALTRIKKAGGMRVFAKPLIEKPPGLAQRGEAVLMLLEARETYALLTGTGHWCAPGVESLVIRPFDPASPDVLAAFGFP